MAELSSNPRARASTLYRMESVYPLDITGECSEIEPGKHIDSHKDRLYGMLAVLCNRALAETLELRTVREPHGLLAPGARCARTLPSKRHVNRLMTVTLEFDAADIQDKYDDFVSECDDYLSHLHSTADPTMHPNVRLMMRGGIATAIEAMDMTYTTLTGEQFALDDDELKSSWRSVFDQTRLGIKEFVMLPTVSSYEETRTAVFEINESNIANFCVAGLRSTESLQNIVDRETIGCPISFEPALVRRLWEWYVELRAEVENPS